MSNSNGMLTINQFAAPLLALAALTGLCYFAAPILIPVATAVTLAYVLWPGVVALRRLKVPHLLAVIIIMLIAVISLTVIGALLINEVGAFSANLPGYWEQLQQLRNEHAKDLPKFLDFLGEDGASILDKIDLSKLSAIPQVLFKGVGSIMSFFGQAVMALLLTAFMLIEQPGLLRRTVSSLGNESVFAATAIVTEVSTQIAGYLWVKFITMVGLAVVFTIGLLIGGVKYAYIWGPLAALLNLVPYAGAYLGAVPPMIMAYVQHGTALSAVWVFVFFMAVQFVESNIISPKLFGRHLNINLLAQLISTLYWGWLWGALGIVLAVPITAALKVFCDHVEALHPIGILLAGDES